MAIADETMAHNEGLIEEARQHVVDAKVMREYVNTKFAEAKHDEEHSVPWNNRRRCLVVDYCQNLALPHLRMSQPGATYYFSPLAVYLFGVVHAGQPHVTMNAYVYHEGEGKKGGNSVASLLYKELKDKGWLYNEAGPQDELTIVFDNCTGQNKNKMVVRLFAFLSESKCHFNKVNLAFLVAGHTKNPCDCLFNLAKNTYRKQNVYSMEQVVSVVSECNDITAVRVQTTDFHDWDAFQDKIYCPLATGSVLRTNIFHSTNS